MIINEQSALKGALDETLKELFKYGPNLIRWGWVRIVVQASHDTLLLIYGSSPFSVGLLLVVLVMRGQICLLTFRRSVAA